MLVPSRRDVLKGKLAAGSAALSSFERPTG